MNFLPSPTSNWPFYKEEGKEEEGEEEKEEGEEEEEEERRGEEEGRRGRGGEEEGKEEGEEGGGRLDAMQRDHPSNNGSFAQLYIVCVCIQ